MAEPPRPHLERLVYESPDGARTALRVWAGDVWLSQSELARLVGTSSQNINQHLRGLGATGPGRDEDRWRRCVEARMEGGRRVCRRLQCFDLGLVKAVLRRIQSPRAAHLLAWLESHPDLQPADATERTHDD